MENQQTPRSRNRPDAGTAVYTRSDGRSSPTAGYAALMESAALVDLSHRAVMRLSGRDPVGMLNAVVTNEVPEEPDLGAYALLLSPKGRVLTDLRVLKARPDVLIDTEPEGAAAARELLGRYAPFSRVTLEDLSGHDEPWGVLGLYGPRAKELLGGPELTEHASAAVSAGGVNVLAAGVKVPVAGYDLLGPEGALIPVREHLLEQGAISTHRDAYETARVAAGVPRFGADITPENFPAEARLLDRAVSFEKGCYPGQETVARMHYRGHPNRELYRLLVVEGAIPTPGAEILQNGKRVGHVTSVAPLPVDGRVGALGYLHRNAEPRETLRAGDAALRASL